MDEPFGAVDPIVRAELQQETIRLQRDLDKTVVFVTHDIDEAFLLGDQVVILEKGAQIAQVGSPTEILANPASEFVADFIGVERGKRALSSAKQTRARHGARRRRGPRRRACSSTRRRMNWVLNNLDSDRRADASSTCG